MRFSARFRFSLPGASLVHRALGPEVRSSAGVSLALRRGTLELRLRAATPSALRSQVNAWLRLVEVASVAADSVLPPPQTRRARPAQ